MSVSERRNPRVPRGVRLAVAGVLLLLALAVPAAGAKDSYPGGGNNNFGNGNGSGNGTTHGQGVGDETFFQDPGAAGTSAASSGGSFAFTGANVLVLVALGAALIGTGVWLRRRGRTVDGLE